MTACTIIARNYLARARVLAQSFLAHNTGHRFVTLIIDGDPDDRELSGLGEVFLLEDLLLPERDVHDMAVIYDVMEFATAVKPALLMRLLTGGDPVVYLDPDIVVFGDLAEAYQKARETGIALTPHVLEPIPRDGAETSERTIMLAGMFNLGFVAVGTPGWPFLRWWHERLLREALVDTDNAMFTDQRWVDWVPALFEHSVIRDRGYNVAYWNLHERPLRSGPDNLLLAGGVPLRFFHLSGWDPGQPWVLSKHTASAGRVVLADSPELIDLCRNYGEALLAAGHSAARVLDYRLDRTPNGERLIKPLRRFFRDELMAGESVGDPRPPNPFLSADEFTTWITEPLTDADAEIDRVGLALRAARPDVKAAFPHPLTDDRADFAYWLRHDPWARLMAGSVRQERIPPPRQTSPSPPRSRAGWNLLAYARAELGVGEAGRRLARAVMHVGVPAHVVGISAEKSRQLHVPDHRIEPALVHANTITCANADQMDRIWSSAKVLGRAEGRQVGLWFWEVDRVPDSWKFSMEKLDELWVTSSFTKRALDRIGACPVHVVPLPVTPSQPTALTRSMVGFPEDRTVFLCTFDFLSVLRRKNPLDVMTAYRNAFGPNDGAVLVVKSINGHQARAELDQVRLGAAGRADILIRDGYVDSIRMRAMIELADCVVSLHRSEGYGLNLVDAMSVGTPVVATGYSGNLAFMDDATAFLVPYEEVEVGPGAEPYEPTSRWAQPDVVAAAHILRSVFDEPASSAAIARAGQLRTNTELAVEMVAKVIRPSLLESTWGL